MRYTRKGILFSHKKEWSLANCDNMDELWGHYVRYVKWVRHKRINNVWFQSSLESIKQNKQKQKTHRCREQTWSPEGGGLGGVGDMGEGSHCTVIAVTRCTAVLALQYIPMSNCKVVQLKCTAYIPILPQRGRKRKGKICGKTGYWINEEELLKYWVPQH